jgi:hypothetical protein
MSNVCEALLSGEAGLQMQALNPKAHNLRLQFCVDFRQKLKGDGFSQNPNFIDEAPFRVCDNVNRDNICIWGADHPHAVVGHVRDSLTVNVFCAVSFCKTYGPFFFSERSVTSTNYIGMLKLWLMPKLQEESKGFIAQQNGESPHFHLHIRPHLNANHPDRWTGLF